MPRIARTALEGFLLGDIEKDYFFGTDKTPEFGIFFRGLWVLRDGKSFSPSGSDASGRKLYG